MAGILSTGRVILTKINTSWIPPAPCIPDAVFVIISKKDANLTGMLIPPVLFEAYLSDKIVFSNHYKICSCMLIVAGKWFCRTILK